MKITKENIATLRAMLKRDDDNWAQLTSATPTLTLEAVAKYQHRVMEAGLDALPGLLDIAEKVVG